MKYPEFIIIGAAKCGTTALLMNLDKHPEIYMGRKSKNSIELHFWGYKFWKRGIDWYKNLFKDGMVCGEKSVDYWISHKSLRLMKKHIPNVKLILCVRNPIDRAFSNYQMHRRANKVGKFTFDLFKRQKVYSAKGLYYNHIIGKVLKHFDRDQLYICVTEYMKKNTTEEMKKIHKFLGVSEFTLKTEKINGNIRKRSGTLGNDLEKNMKEKFYRVWDRGDMTIDPEMRKLLLEYYKPHNEKFFKFIGYRIKEWEK